MPRPSLDDSLTELGAQHLAEKIRTFWRKQGIEIEVRVESVVIADAHDRTPTPHFVVRSNLGALLTGDGA
jgi:hypothetical protein